MDTINGHVKEGVLEQGQTQGSNLTMYQKSLTTDPFINTCEVDAISPEVAIRGCRTHVPTTIGNTSRFK
jgi:hypothetical protein